ncbi:hypothetical protein A9R00_04190 [Oleispira antarctica]|uniref:Conjugal transfer protein TraF n=1 Tax=Oleispira antarctica TaxID=188908 RepID=A0A1Y5HU13_OLEAN|nr:hypothetical protein A9R00_04190 [Oleispira antarctica]
MIKRSLLSASITLAALALVQQASAAPLLPIDARGLAMGGTGVASAKLAHAPQYNPALLSTANDEDDFAIIFPQFGIIAADEDEFIDTAQGLTEDDYKNFDESLIDHFTTITEDLADELDLLETQITNLDNLATADFKDLSTSEINAISAQTTSLEASLGDFTSGTADLKSTTFDLTSEFSNLSASGVRVNAGLNATIAIPSKSFGAAISFNNNVMASGRTIFSEEDQALINAYAEGVDEYSNLTQEYVSATNELIDSVAAFQNSPSNPAAAEAIVDLNQEAVDAKKAELDAYEKLVNGQAIISTDGSGGITVNEEPDLTSLAHVIAIAISELGITLSHSFDIAGHDIAIGITPKMQIIKTFNYVTLLENDEDIDEEALKETEQDFSDFNLDAGIAYQFGGSKQWQVGLVAKNLLSKEYEAESNVYGPDLEVQKTTISLDTQFRSGISHTTDWSVVAIDVDLMENDPVAFEAPTQYASIGAELDLFDLFQLRGGYRTNLSVDDASMVSAGLGFSPFGVHVDLAAMANPSDPEKELGVAMELGFYF